MSQLGTPSVTASARTPAQRALALSLRQHSSSCNHRVADRRNVATMPACRMPPGSAVESASDRARSRRLRPHKSSLCRRNRSAADSGCRLALRPRERGGAPDPMLLVQRRCQAVLGCRAATLASACGPRLSSTRKWRRSRRSSIHKKAPACSMLPLGIKIEDRSSFSDRQGHETKFERRRHVDHAQPRSKTGMRCALSTTTRCALMHTHRLAFQPLGTHDPAL